MAGLFLPPPWCFLPAAQTPCVDSEAAALNLGVRAGPAVGKGVARLL